MSLLSAFRSTAKKTLLSTMIAGSALFCTQAVAQEPTTQVVTVVARTSGSGGSDWRSKVLLTDTQGNGTSGEILILPAGQSTPEATAMRIPYTLPVRGAIEIDPLEAVGFTGAATILVQGENTGVVAKYWNQRPDGTQLSQLTNATPRSEMLQPGDIAYFTLPGDGYRFNIFAYGEDQTLPAIPTSEPKVAFEWFNQNGDYKLGANKNLLDHGLSQFSPATTSIFGGNPQPYDTIKATVTGGTVQFLGSPVQNNNGNDDGGSQNAVVNKLLTDGTMRMAPLDAEQNDTYHMEIIATSREGTTISGIAIDADGNGTFEHTITPENPTNTYYFKETNPLGIAPGTYTPQALIAVTDNGVYYSRLLKAKTYTVKAEENYTFPASTANPIIKAHKERIAYILSQGVYSGDMKQYPAEVWEQALDMYQDGINNANNMEASAYTVRDIDNCFEVRGIDTRVDVVHGLTELHMDELRRILESE